MSHFYSRFPPEIIKAINEGSRGASALQMGAHCKPQSALTTDPGASRTHGAEAQPGSRQRSPRWAERPLGFADAEASRMEKPAGGEGSRGCRSVPGYSTLCNANASERWHSASLWRSAGLGINSPWGDLGIAPRKARCPRGWLQLCAT